MTGPEHYRMAEELLEVAEELADKTSYVLDAGGDPSYPNAAHMAILGAAQVHATLAVAAAMAEAVALQREMIERLDDAPAPPKLRPVDRHGWPAERQP